jgi:hypothetical protein
LVVSGEARLRSWFLRNLLEAAERELGSAALASLPAKVPARLRPHLSLDRLRTAVAVDGIPLDEGEEVLLGLDQALGDGTGRMLERLSREMHARQLLQAKGTVRLGDLSGTVARLRGPLEHAFVDTEVLFELSRTELGFTLTVGVPGRPRATRALSHLAQGAIHAAERFAREGRETTRLYAETFADRAVITLNLRRASEPPPPGFDPPTLRRPPSIARLPGASLSDEVARILNPSLAATRTSGQFRASPVPKGTPGSQPSPASAAPTTPVAFDATRSSRPSERPAAPSDEVFLRQRLPSNPPPSFPDIPTVTLRRPSEMPPAPVGDTNDGRNESNRPTSIPPPSRSSRPPPSKS